MTLAQFALAAQATPKWVQNAAQALGTQFSYSVDEARRLGLARILNTTAGLPLRKAWEIAGAALRNGEKRDLVVAESPDGSVHVVVDVLRYLSSFTAALSLANRYEPRAPGRPRKQDRDPIGAAREYGIDISLLKSGLSRSVEQRIREADENAEFVRSIRGRAGR